MDRPQYSVSRHPRLFALSPDLVARAAAAGLCPNRRARSFPAAFTPISSPASDLSTIGGIVTVKRYRVSLSKFRDRLIALAFSLTILVMDLLRAVRKRVPAADHSERSLQDRFSVLSSPKYSLQAINWLVQKRTPHQYFRLSVVSGDARSLSVKIPNRFEIGNSLVKGFEAADGLARSVAGDDQMPPPAIHLIGSLFRLGGRRCPDHFPVARHAKTGWCRSCQRKGQLARPLIF